MSRLMELFVVRNLFTAICSLNMSVLNSLKIHDPIEVLRQAISLRYEQKTNLWSEIWTFLKGLVLITK